MPVGAAAAQGSVAEAVETEPAVGPDAEAAADVTSQPPTVW